MARIATSHSHPKSTGSESSQIDTSGSCHATVAPSAFRVFLSSEAGVSRTSPIPALYATPRIKTLGVLMEESTMASARCATYSGILRLTESAASTNPALLPHWCAHHVKYKGSTGIQCPPTPTPGLKGIKP